MMEAVFISDLHLNPEEADITARFNRFIEWALHNTKSVYILGDLFHVWAGDDGLDAWSTAQALQLARLAEQGIQVYFMPGNRDFLLGARFLQLSRMTRLNEPSVIMLGGKKILLVHGDRYCTLDKRHQWLMRLTRNALFPKLFLKSPYRFRVFITQTVRKRSQGHLRGTAAFMDVVPSVLIRHMKQCKVTHLIHGHTHRPGLIKHEVDGTFYLHYVLSDWDDNPSMMCYDKANGFYFTRLLESEHGDTRRETSSIGGE